MSSNTGNTLLALLTGAAIGAGVGILYAPDKGDVTRKKIKKNAKKTQKELEKQLKKTTNQLSAKANHARTEFEHKLEDTLSSMSYKADDILVALEEKLEELRAKNAKLQKEGVVNKIESKVAKATK
ncbi:MULTISPECIES: YtxH domain-containing protein [Galbibacter]|uniref:YtxH domain-containing protein n=1 Tax=Galbibacter pacificus TaxID=2996052 RepID=A0ABT6FWJ0_9FLAO|nr:YtxH domain-containing protein [Galbibacter pacificus]MDG3584176.1 YtxH domain-containing protein [Galbibacter pacificus]MDG3587643.1 YtxH domain-containing protein [Galbibacter pacificus]